MAPMLCRRSKYTMMDDYELIRVRLNNNIWCLIIFRLWHQSCTTHRKAERAAAVRYRRGQRPYPPNWNVKYEPSVVLWIGPEVCSMAKRSFIGLGRELPGFKFLILLYRFFKKDCVYRVRWYAILFLEVLHF